MITLYHILYFFGLFRKRYRFLLIKNQFDNIEEQIKEHSMYLHKDGVLIVIDCVYSDFMEYKNYLKHMRRVLFSFRDTKKITNEQFDELIQKYKYLRSSINIFIGKVRTLMKGDKNV